MLMVPVTAIALTARQIAQHQNAEKRSERAYDKQLTRIFQQHLRLERQRGGLILSSGQLVPLGPKQLRKFQGSEQRQFNAFKKSLDRVLVQHQFLERRYRILSPFQLPSLPTANNFFIPTLPSFI